jgi:hypothetical protein
MFTTAGLAFSAKSANDTMDTLAQAGATITKISTRQRNTIERAFDFFKWF